MIEGGESAPDSTERGVDNWPIGPFTLSESTNDGQFVVLNFYMLDLSPVVRHR